MLGERYTPEYTEQFRDDIAEVICTGNFITFYVVLGKVMEVRRFIYAHRDLPAHLP